MGAPLPCNLIKLVDVPEKNYFASKGEGEVSGVLGKKLAVNTGVLAHRRVQTADRSTFRLLLQCFRV